MQKVKLYDSPWMAVLFAALTVVWMAVIFSFSAEPATVSGDRSTGIAETVLSAVIPGFESLSAAEQEELLSAADHVLRKTAHFCVYATLGALLCLTSLGIAATGWTHLLRSLVIGAAYAASDEIHQAFVPGRGPGVLDVFLDSAGALVGILFILLVVYKMKQKKNRC